ncbi:MAG: trypsin-like serine protease [Methylotenera sp.]|nr:trypsin-like serine protease [Oligoflexia bacterium]
MKDTQFKIRISDFPVLLIIIFSASLSHSPASHADIVGGDEVKRQDSVRHSTVALYEPSADGRSGALCTASLISSDTAVTAAHCLTPGGPKPVMIFGNDIHSPNSEKRQVIREAVNPKWRTHQGKGMDQGDIALVKFPGGLPEGYQPIERANPDLPIKKGGKVVLAGYGISDALSKSGAGVLRKATVKLDDPRPGKSEMVLGQTHGHGACHGDSGGPAFIRQGGRAVLAGVTNRSYPDSAPDDCAHQVVYTKVAAYQPWIDKTEKRFENGPESERQMRAVKQKMGKQLHSHGLSRQLARQNVRKSKNLAQHRIPSRKRLKGVRSRTPSRLAAATESSSRPTRSRTMHSTRHPARQKAVKRNSHQPRLSHPLLRKRTRSSDRSAAA